MNTEHQSTSRPAGEDFTALETTLREALRLGPGGLRDEQRLRVMAAARRIEEQPLRLMPASPGFGRSGLGIAAAAAVAISGILVFLAANLELGNRNTAAAHKGGSGEWQVRLAPTPATEISEIRADNAHAAAIRLGFQATRDSHIARLRPNVAVDGFASMSRQLREDGVMPNADSLAIDEVLNYVHSGDPALIRDAVSLSAEAGPCPWNPDLRLVHVVVAAGGNESGQVVAKDLTLAVDFNPQRVAGYRLIGKAANAADDQDGSGADLLAGRSATLMYEIAPATAAMENDETWLTDASRPGAWSARADLVAVRAEYALPGGGDRQSREIHVAGWNPDLAASSEAFQFAASVVWAGRLIEGDPASTGRFADVIRLATTAMRHDPDGRKAEFVGLMRRAERLSARP